MPQPLLTMKHLLTSGPWGYSLKCTHLFCKKPNNIRSFIIDVTFSLKTNFWLTLQNGNHRIVLQWKPLHDSPKTHDSSGRNGSWFVPFLYQTSNSIMEDPFIKGQNTFFFLKRRTAISCQHWSLSPCSHYLKLQRSGCYLTIPLPWTLFHTVQSKRLSCLTPSPRGHDYTYTEYGIFSNKLYH